MENLKIAYDQFAENQKVMLDTLTGNTQKAIDLFEIDPKFETYSQEMLEAYLAAAKTFLAGFAPAEKPEQVIENMMAAMNKLAEQQQTILEKTNHLMTSFFEQFSVQHFQQKMNTMAELFQHNLEVMTTTAKKNMEVMQSVYTA
ncbi:MAG: hypothetical protein D6772_12870 [Bacteroidetes bacterium]|nr:MAG: hypothetical protein D6772_12870 [Bacteroidota bacterium]